MPSPNETRNAQARRRYYAKHRDKILAQMAAKRRGPEGEVIKARERAYYQTNKDVIQRKRRVWPYGITLDDLACLEDFHAGKCAICKKARKLVIEHNHKTGRVRGLTCQGCNACLAWFERNRDAVEHYLIEV